MKSQINLLSPKNDWLECQIHQIQQVIKFFLMCCSKVIRAMTGKKKLFLYGLIERKQHFVKHNESSHGASPNGRIPITHCLLINETNGGRYLKYEQNQINLSIVKSRVLRQQHPPLLHPPLCNIRGACLGKYSKRDYEKNGNGSTSMILNDEYFAH